MNQSYLRDIMNRCKEEVIENILDICKEPTNKTNIVYQASLNFRNINAYLPFLIKSGALEVSGEAFTKYKTTPKGIELLKRMKAIDAQLGRKRK
jgi:predicted transcriptional regulator